ncbi:MAG: restriction endonuclease subunit S [Phreatobacter sp.]|uniref:restriction endonuclease subunit S n=1 Tax=Phreatobacter sp. TaxID=1966341 RepID=UPI002735A844|nr:restriction endonuclease subunit S [Phreatobacter sp.]MDP2804002.1 restriction endonuclease subunit S [Phreatobacter sp.]
MDEVAESVEWESDGPWELPEGWAWKLLIETLERVTTTDPKRDFGKSAFHYVDLGAIENCKIVNPQSITGDAAPSRARQLVTTGDTIFSCVRVYLKNIALVGEGLTSPVASTAFCVLRPSEAIDARYLNYFVRSQRFIEWMIPLQRGNSPPAVVDSDIKAQFIPLAPLAEQRRIVARVDALFAEIAEGEAALEAARKGLDTFRRALLKAAVTGELTKDWRENNPVTETGHDLLARIKADRTAKGQTKGRGKRAADAAPLDTSALPVLPEGWKWGTVDHVKISDQRNGISIAGSSSPPGTKAMRLDALTAHGINLDAIRYIPLPEERVADYRVNAGDLLISRANGSAEFVGRAVYVSDIAETVVFPDTIIRYPLGRDEQIGRWMEMAWNSPLGRSQIRRLAKTTAGILKISQEDISQISLPIPPPAEAGEILRRVSEALAASTDTLTILDEETADGARLKQSILKAAFEGRLVPQDPGDEPASAILARLNATPSTPTRARRGRARKSAP